MSKSVLVIDTPTNCYDCPFGTRYCSDLEYEGLCELADCLDYDVILMTEEHYDCESKSRPDWCPLMDLPEKDNGDYPANTFDAGFAEGRNQCIDEITGKVKQMERLTERYDVTPDGESDVWVKQHDYISAARKLCDYEDLEEQGLLVRLPCKVGDDLYCIVNGEVKKLKVHSFGVPDFEITDIEFKYVDGFKIVRFVGEVGKTVFLTREEAEKKLEEMKK